MGNGLLRKRESTMAVERRRADPSDAVYLWAVGECGSFSAAARALGVSTSTLTRAVESLELRLGQQLVVKTPSGVLLTEAGEEVSERGRTIDQQLAAIDRLSSQDRLDEGRVTLVAPDGISAYVIAPQLADFSMAHPKIQVALDSGFWAHDPVGLQADIQIQFDDVADPEHRAFELAYIHYCLFASPAYVAMYGEPRTLAEAAGHRYLHHVAQHRQKSAWAPKFEAFQALANIVMETNNSVALMQAVQAGSGIAALPSGVVRGVPELVMVGEGPVATVRLWMSHHHERSRGRIRIVADWLRTLFDERDRPWYRPEFVHPNDFRLDKAA